MFHVLSQQTLTTHHLPQCKVEVLEDLIPYIEADGGWLEFVEIEHETNFVKVRLGGACSTCAMSAITLKQGIESKLMHEIPDCYGVVQVL